MSSQPSPAPGGYSGDPDERCCSMDGWCRGYRIEDGKRLPALTPRAFCEACEQLIGRSIEELPDLYGRLGAELGNKGQGRPGDRVSMSKEAPIPLRLDVDALQREIVFVLASWDERVRDVAGLFFPGTAAARRRRAAQAVDYYTGTLADRLVTLLSLEPAAMARDIRPEDIQPGDTGVMHVSAGYATVIRDLGGADAGMEILELHRRARSKLQETTPREHLDVPCPTCDALSLQRFAGSDWAAECTLCGRQLDREGYLFYVEQYAVFEQTRRLAAAMGHVTP